MVRSLPVQTLDPLLERIESLEDDTFVAKLPSLRAGFDALSPAGHPQPGAIMRRR